MKQWGYVTLVIEWNNNAYIDIILNHIYAFWNFKDFRIRIYSIPQFTKYLNIWCVYCGTVMANFAHLWMMMNESDFVLDWHAEQNFTVLAHKNNSPQEDASLCQDILFWTVIALTPECCVINREAAPRNENFVYYLMYLIVTLKCYKILRMTAGWIDLISNTNQTDTYQQLIIFLFVDSSSSIY